MTKPKRDNPAKEKPQSKKQSEQYDKKHEKGHFPRKVWPTDSEKHKGPKF